MLRLWRVSFALFNPDSPQAKEFEHLAEEYLAQYQSNLRSSITWNAVGNAIAGAVWLCPDW